MQKKPHLTTFTIGFMAGVALLYDAVQFFFSWLGFGWLIMPIFYLHFWFWFHLYGIKFITGKHAGNLGIGALIETFTAGIAPAFFVNVLTIALKYKLQEAVPGAGMAMDFADKKRNAAIKTKNNATLNNMTMVKPMSRNNELYGRLAKERGESNKRFSDEVFNKRKQESDEHFERIRQSGQRQDQLRYGGGTKEGLEQYYAKSMKEWRTGTGRSEDDKAA